MNCTNLVVTEEIMLDFIEVAYLPALGVVGQIILVSLLLGFIAGVLVGIGAMWRKK